MLWLNSKLKKKKLKKYQPYNTTPAPGPQGLLHQRGVRSCLLGMPKATLIEKASSAWLPKHELNKDNNRHAREDGRKGHTASALHKLPTTKECQEQETITFPGEEHTIGIQYQTVSQP